MPIVTAERKLRNGKRYDIQIQHEVTGINNTEYIFDQAAKGFDWAGSGETTCSSSENSPNGEYQ